jgi:hypothetical protein
MKTVKIPKADFEAIDHLDEQEFKALKKILSDYTVPFPSDYQIEATVKTLKQYVPSKQKTYEGYSEKLQILFNRALTEAGLISKTYWLSSVVLFVMGYLITSVIDNNYYYGVAIFAPIPFILGLLEVLKGREQGVLEIELTCKISAREIMLSRLVVIGLYNTFLNTLFSAITSLIIPEVVLWKIMISWIAPFTFISCLALWLAMRVRGGFAVTAVLLIWMVAVLAVLSSQPALRYLAQVDALVYLIVSGLGMILFLFQIRLSFRRVLHKRGIDHLEQ